MAKIIKMKDLLEGKLKKDKLTESWQRDINDLYKQTILPAFSEDLPQFKDKKEADKALKLLKKLVNKLKVSDRYINFIGEGKLDELGNFAHDSHINLGTPSGINTGKQSGDKDFYQGFSSKEAKTVIDKELKDWAKQLRKVQGKVVKNWMQKAKAGVIDYFDLVRGMQTGDISRAHPYETKFLMALLNKDKIMNRFRSYFGGKKGKRGRRK